jgi:hypothetical protein
MSGLAAASTFSRISFVPEPNGKSPVAEREALRASKYSANERMTPLDSSEVVKLLAEYGRRRSLAGGNPYPKAYLRAAESLAALAEPLDRIVAEGRLREIPGVGDAIADIITRLHRTGTHPSLERMRREIPEGVSRQGALRPRDHV